MEMSGERERGWPRNTGTYSNLPVQKDESSSLVDDMSLLYSRLTIQWPAGVVSFFIFHFVVVKKNFVCVLAFVSKCPEGIVDIEAQQIDIFKF